MKSVFEDFIDNIKTDIDDSQETVSVSKESSKFSHEYIILSSFRTKEDVKNMIPHIRQICKTVFNMFQNNPLISDFYGEMRTSDPYTEFDIWPQFAKNELLRVPLDVIHPEDIVKKCLSYMEENYVKKSFMFDICVRFDYTVEKLSYAQAFEVIKQFIKIRDFIYEFSRKFCASNVSQAMTLDGERFNPNLNNGDVLYVEQMFCHIIGAETPDEVMKANDFVESRVNKMRNAISDNYSVPEELVYLFRTISKKFDPYWLAVCGMQISLDDVNYTMNAYIPQNVRVNFAIVQFLAYVFNEWNKRYHKNELYEIDIRVMGTLNINKDLGYLKNNMWMVSYIKRLVLIGTPFKLLDIYVLPKTEVSEIDIVNPIFNTIGSDEQKYKVSDFMWKSKDIKFSSKDYDISLEKLNNKTYIVARKK